MRTSTSTHVATATHRVKFRKFSKRDQCRPSEKLVARIPRVARLLALAHKIDGMIRAGELKNWAEAARLIGVTRARMTQIANLLLLAPGIQHAILDHTSMVRHEAPICERHLRAAMSQPDWQEQE